MEKGLDFVTMFPEGAAAGVFPAQGVGAADFLEEGRLEGVEDACLGYVAVRERGEGAGFRGAVGGDVEEAAAGCEASAKGLLIAREGEEDDVPKGGAALLQEGLHLLDVPVLEGQMLRSGLHGHVFHIEDILAAKVAQAVNEFS